MHHIQIPLDHSIIEGHVGNPYKQPHLRREIREWLIANIGSERGNRRLPWNQDVWFENTVMGAKYCISHEVAFKYRKDAMLFKLTWV